MGKSIIIQGESFADVAIPEDELQTITSVVTGKYYRDTDPPELYDVTEGYIANYVVTAGKRYRVLIDQSSLIGQTAGPLGPHGCLVTWLVDGVETSYGKLGDFYNVYNWDFVVTVPSGVNGMAVGCKAINGSDIDDIIQVYEKAI